MINHVWGLFTHPEREWQQIRQEDESIGHIYLTHTLLLAAIAPLCAYIGTTWVGWVIGEQAPMQLTHGSASGMAFMSYLTLLAGVAVMGGFIHWMARTYGANPSLARCIAFATYTATPLFIGGLAALYPHLWLGALVGSVAIGYTVYLLYTGLVPFMNVSSEEGFMFSSAILAVGLVVLVVIMAFTVVLWGLGIGPQYTG